MIFDLHNDILTSGMSQDELSKTLIAYEKDSNINKITLAVWTTESQNPLQLIQKAQNTIKNHDKFYYAIEDLYFVNSQNLDSIIYSEYNCKPLYVGLTWNYANALAGGALSRGGLTLNGKNTINALESANIIIDTAHLNKESFWDVIKHAKKTVINSHCCFDNVFAHPRNLDDKQIKAIIERNGIIGLTLVPKFLSANPSRIVDVFEHIDYFISRFGCKNLAIGTDFFGSDETPIGLNNYEDFAALRFIMKSHGYTDDTVSALFYKNATSLF